MRFVVKATSQVSVSWASTMAISWPAMCPGKHAACSYIFAHTHARLQQGNTNQVRKDSDSRAFAPYKLSGILQSVTEVNRFGIRQESPKCHEASDIAALLDARFTTSQTPLSLDLASVCERLKACEHYDHQKEQLCCSGANSI